LRLVLLVLGFLAGALIFGRQGDSGEAIDPAAARGASDSAETDDASLWTCSMHPQIPQSGPGQCPLCGMDLIPVSSSGGGRQDDPSRVVLSDRAKVLAKLRTVAVRRRSDATSEIRLLGLVEPNETTLKTITAWTGGRIDRLRVNVTGEKVRAGQTIATLYSPEVYAAHQDLLVARGQVDRLAAGVESSRLAARAALMAARERLLLLGVPDRELTRMARQKKPSRTISIRSPFGGTVIERIASEGAYVTTGTPLYRIANLDSLWIQLDAYESDISRLTVHQPVVVEIEALPGEEFAGEITFIDPTVDSKRRTARVRVEIGNSDGRLRPGMFAQAVVASKADDGPNAPLVIPSSAPLFTGRRAIVYVEVPNEERTTYEARTVRLGPRLGDYYPVVAGLSEGETVVSRGAFAIDADLQIRGGRSMMTRPDDREPGSWDAVLELSREQLDQLTPIVAGYLVVQKSLALDDLSDAQRAAVGLGSAIADATVDGSGKAKDAWVDLSVTLNQHTHHVANAKTIEDARMGFEGLSTGVATILHSFGNPLDVALIQAHCPMAFGSRGANWVQKKAEKINNSYFGEVMLTCGEAKSSVEPRGHLPKPVVVKESSIGPLRAGGHHH